MTELLAIAFCVIAYALYRVVGELLIATHVDGMRRGHEIAHEIYSRHMLDAMTDAYRQGYANGRKSVNHPTLYERN